MDEIFFLGPVWKTLVIAEETDRVRIAPQPCGGDDQIIRDGLSNASEYSVSPVRWGMKENAGRRHEGAFNAIRHRNFFIVHAYFLKIRATSAARTRA
jgi:hypothetical protein